MTFTTITTIMALSLAYNFRKIKKHSKHDKYLYKFCQLRREIMSYLRINHHIISKREYQATKQILDILNKTINLYSKNQASNIFNIRKFAKFVSETKYLSDSSKKLIDCDNCLIKDFRDKLKCNIIVTFFAYTPLIFVEIFLKILYFLGLFFVKFQIFRLKKTGLEFINLNKDFASINTSKKEFKF